MRVPRSNKTPELDITPEGAFNGTELIPFLRFSNYSSNRLRDFSPLVGVRNDTLLKGPSPPNVISREPGNGERELPRMIL